MAKNDHQRASVSTPINNFLYFFAYFICGVELPALWMIVTEAIYDLRESHNYPWTFDTYFTTQIIISSQQKFVSGLMNNLVDIPSHLNIRVWLERGFCRAVSQ